MMDSSALTTGVNEVQGAKASSGVESLHPSYARTQRSAPGTGFRTAALESIVALDDTLVMIRTYLKIPVHASRSRRAPNVALLAHWEYAK